MSTLLEQKEKSLESLSVRFKINYRLWGKKAEQVRKGLCSRSQEEQRSRGAEEQKRRGAEEQRSRLAA